MAYLSILLQPYNLSSVVCVARRLLAPLALGRLGNLSFCYRNLVLGTLDFTGSGSWGSLPMAYTLQAEILFLLCLTFITLYKNSCYF